MTAILK